MITDRPAIDWLTLTTNSTRAAIEIDAIINSIVGATVTMEKTIGGYNGRVGDGFFIGEGVQKGSQHFMINLYGPLADKYMFHPLKVPADCTRIDLQVTVEWPFGNSNNMFIESSPIMVESEIERGQRARKIRPILDPLDGFCTLYVGSKTSKKFYRIYIKGDEDTGLFIRFETVFKGKKGLAKKVYFEVSENPSSMVRFLAGELGTLPYTPITNEFFRYFGLLAGDVLPQGRERPTPQKTLNWIVRQVMPAFKRVIGNEDTRFTAGVILEDLYKFWRNIE